MISNEYLLKNVPNPHGLKLPENFIKDDLEFFLPYFDYKLLEPESITLRNVFYSHSGTITNLWGKKIKDHLPWRKWGKHLDQKFWIKKILKSILKKDSQFYFSRGRNLVISVNPWGNNYFHWMIEVIPKLLFLKDHIKDITLVVPSNCNRDYQIETYKALNIEHVFLKKDITFLKKVNICSPFSEFTGFLNADFIHKVALLFDNNFKASEKPNNRIYISRKYAERRKVVNEEELIPILQKHGFKIIYPEKLSFRESISLYKTTSVLVSIHGAALTNMIFLHPESAVFELRLEKIIHDKCFFVLANNLDIRYYYQNCLSKKKSRDHISADIIVEPDIFEVNLIKILSD